MNIDSDERSVFDVGELKDSTANGTEVDKGTSERNMHTSYTTSDGGADLQSEASSVPYRQCAGGTVSWSEFAPNRSRQLTDRRVAVSRDVSCRGLVRSGGTMTTNVWITLHSLAIGGIYYLGGRQTGKGRHFQRIRREV